MTIHGEMQKLESFFRRRIPTKSKTIPLNEQGQFLHEKLLDVTFNIPLTDIKRRRASMCLDGTPIVYSLKITRRQDQPSFRMLVEPGGIGITIPEQINRSLQAVDIMLHRLGWESAVEDINAVITRIFPNDVNALKSWWGGMWLGMDFSSDKVELRLYLNLRHGEAVDRWQRVANLLSWFGDDSLTVPFKMLVEKVSPHAIPVGLGVVVSNRVRGFRIYVGMHAPEYKTITAAFPQHLNCTDSDLGNFCRSFTSLFGLFARQSVTLGYDFGIKKDGHLHPQITRTKVDISCQFLGNNSLHLESFLDNFLETNHFNSLPMGIFFKDLHGCFGGWDVEYVSLGFNNGLEHVTVYTKPHGYKQT